MKINLAVVAEAMAENLSKAFLSVAEAWCGRHCP